MSAKSVPISQVYDARGKTLMKQAMYYLIANDTTWGYTEQKVFASTDVGQYLANWKGAEAAGVPRLSTCTGSFGSCKAKTYSNACTHMKKGGMF